MQCNRAIVKCHKSMFLLPGHTTDTENQSSKWAREEKRARETEVYGVGIKREAEGWGCLGLFLVSSLTVFVLCLSFYQHAALLWRQAEDKTVKESKFELHVVNTNQGHLSQQHPRPATARQHQNIIHTGIKLSHLISWSFLPAFSHLHLFLPLSVTLFF